MHVSDAWGARWFHVAWLCQGGAPPKSDFEKVWDSAGEGRPAFRGVDGVGASRKVNQMMHCLAEALYRLDRKFMSNASVVGIARDERDFKLLMKFTACNERLEVSQSSVHRTTFF